MPATGGCLCGEVRYRIDGEIGPAGYCHCEDCRRLTGGPFVVSAPIRSGEFTIESGQLGSFTKTGHSGSDLTRHFCANCGSQIYTSAEKHPDIHYIKCGTLDDPGLVEPQLEAWCSSRVAWARIPDNLIQHQKGRSA